jgi:hypothetical protein
MSNTKTGSFIKTPSSITVVVDGKLFSVNKGAPAFAAVEKLIKEGNFAAIPDTIDRAGAIAKKIEAKASGFSELVIRERRVYLKSANGESRLQGFEITRLLEMMDEGYDIKPLAKFIVRVRQNPSEAIRARLYEFMEYGNLPLTEDGCFLAYKVVRHNYLDKHSGTMDNSVGKTVEMPRAKVNDNDQETCSRGLHACSKEYIQHFLSRGGSDRLMVVKIAPEDVVSIPVDYNNTKLRCCKYDVIAEITAADDPEFFGRRTYVSPAAVIDDGDWDETASNDVRVSFE